MDTIEQMTGPAIQLFTSHGETANAVIPLRWCISKETSAELIRREARNPHLFIVVTRENPYYSGHEQEISRRLVPLLDEMCYIEFQGPGRKTIHATIVWDSKGDSMALQKDFNDSTVTPFLRPDGSLNRSWNGGRYAYLGEAQLDVVVPKEMFAQEPPAWLNSWVNHCFYQKPANQCHFRKRLLFAFTIQPILDLVLFIVYLAVKSMAAGVLMVVGMRGISFQPFRHPLQYAFEVKDIWRDVDFEKNDSVFFRRKDGMDRLLTLQFLSPPFFAAIFLAITAVACWVLPLTEIPWLLLLKLTLIVIGAMTFFFLILDGAKALERRIRPREEDDARRQREKEEEEREHLQRLAAELDLLACNTTSRIADLNSLPKRRRTVYLRFQRLKAEMCRPYPRRE